VSAQRQQRRQSNLMRRARSAPDPWISGPTRLCLWCERARRVRLALFARLIALLQPVAYSCSVLPCLQPVG